MPADPILELFVVRFTVPEVSVMLPVRVMLPLFPITDIVPPAPVDTFAFIATPRPLSAMMPLPDMLSAEDTVMALPVAVREMSPETSEIGPIVIELAVTASDLEPSVIVCPDEVKAPLLLNCKL